jgi:hypothetical protein
VTTSFCWCGRCLPFGGSPNAEELSELVGSPLSEAEQWVAKPEFRDVPGWAPDHGKLLQCWGAWKLLKYNLAGDGLLSSIGQISKRIYRRNLLMGRG